MAKRLDVDLKVTRLLLEIGVMAVWIKRVQEGEIIIEHVNVAELPDAWRARLPVPRTTLVTVRIETEDAAAAWPAGFFSQVAGAWCGEPLKRSPQGTITPRAALD